MLTSEQSFCSLVKMSRASTPSNLGKPAKGPDQEPEGPGQESLLRAGGQLGWGTRLSIQFLP